MEAAAGPPDATRGSEAPDPPRWIVNAPANRGIALPSIAEMFRYRELAIALAIRDLQVRYKQTFLGVAWAVFQPLAATGALTLVFHRLANVESGAIPYAVFVLAGMLAWNFFSSGLSRCANALVGNEDMITKIYFPRLLLGLAAVLPGVADFAVGFILFVGFLVATGTGITPALFALPLLIVLLGLMTFGIGSLLAAVNVRYRDVGNALPLLLQAWLFLSPVAYPSSLAGDSELLYHLNPMAGMVDAFRWSLLGEPSLSEYTGLSLVIGFAVAMIGLWTFGRMERRFADVI